MSEAALDRRALGGGLVRSARLLALAAPLALVGCAALQRSEPEQQTIRHPFYALEEVQPADMAVVPVENVSEDAAAPVAALRRALYSGLSERLYSPIELDYLDVRWAEAGIGLGTGGGVEALGQTELAPLELGGLLRVVVRTWDRSLLGTHGVIRATLVAEVLDAGDPAGDPLWGVTIERRVRQPYDQMRLDQKVLYEGAAAILAEEILKELPARDPVPAELR